VIRRLGRRGRIEGTRELVFPRLPSLWFIAFKTRTWRLCASIMERKTGRKPSPHRVWPDHKTLDNSA